MTRPTATPRDATPALLPKLRFPEFQNAPEWKPVSLGDASVPVEDRVGERKLTPVSISAGIGFVPQAEKFGRDISGNQYKLYTVVRDGDFVYNKGKSLRFPQGCIYQLRGWGEVAAPNVFICFRLQKGYSDGFFQSCFEKNTHGLQLKRHITSGARSNGLLNISRDTFFSVEIPTPSSAEQRKIAECLSTLDELIGAESQKLDALKAHKKGLMQQLFPREGETLPRLRFPEFQNVGDWVKTPFSELCDVKHGYAFESEFFSDEGDYVLLTPDKYAFDFLVITAPFGAAVYVDGLPVDGKVCEVAPGDGLDEKTRGAKDPPFVVYRCQLSFPVIDPLKTPPDNVLVGKQNDGVHRVQSDYGIGVLVYGFDYRVSYAYAGGTELIDIDPN